jgi:hypothetical protein
LAAPFWTFSTTVERIVSSEGRPPRSGLGLSHQVELNEVLPVLQATEVAL